MKNKYVCESVRLCRFLYSLGFDKESIYIDGQEKWAFDRNQELQDSLDFYFNMRKKLKEYRLKGVNENAKNTNGETMDTRGR